MSKSKVFFVTLDIKVGLAEANRIREAIGCFRGVTAVSPIIREEARKRWPSAGSPEEAEIIRLFRDFIHSCPGVVVDPNTRQRAGGSDDVGTLYQQIETFSIDWIRQQEDRERMYPAWLATSRDINALKK